MDLITNHAYGLWPVENKEKKARPWSKHFYYRMEQAAWDLAFMYNEPSARDAYYDTWTERRLKHDEAEIEAEKSEDPEIFRYRELSARLEEWDW